MKQANGWFGAVILALVMMAAAGFMSSCQGNRAMETRSLGGDELTVSSTFRDDRGQRVVNTVIDNTDKAAGAAGQVAGSGVFTQSEENHYNNRMGVHNSEMPRASIRMLYSVNGQNNVSTDVKKTDFKGSMDKIASAFAQGDRVGIAAAAGEGVLGIVDMIAAGDKPSTADSKSNAIQIDLYGPNATSDAVGAAGEMTKIQTASLQRPRATILDKMDVLIDRRMTTNELEFAKAAVQAQRDVDIAEIEASKPAVNSKPSGGSTAPVKPWEPILSGTNVFSAAEVEEILSELKSKPNGFIDGANPNNPNVRRLIGMYGRRITHFAGGEGSAPSEKNLWKPEAETSNGTVALFASSTRIGTVTLGDETVNSISIANGWRPHVRFSKRGGQYPAGIKLDVKGVGSIILNNPGERLDGFTLTGGSSTPVVDTVVDGDKFSTSGGTITLPAAVAANLVRPPKLLHNDMENGVRWDAIPNIQATQVNETTWTVGGELPPGAEAWLLNVKPTYTGPVTERGGDWHNIAVTLDGKFVPAKR